MPDGSAIDKPIDSCIPPSFVRKQSDVQQRDPDEDTLSYRSLSSLRSSRALSPAYTPLDKRSLCKKQPKSDIVTSQVETQFMTLQKEEHEKKMNQLDELHKARMEILAVEKEIAIEKLESLRNSARLEQSQQRSAPVKATYDSADGFLQYQQLY